MRFLKLKALVLGLVLAFPGAYAAPVPGVMILALNCPDRNTDLNCPNNVLVQEQQRAKQQAQQQEQQRARQQAQQQEQQRARQQAQQQEQQRARQQAQQQEQQRARQQAQQQEQQRGRQQAQDQEQQRAKQQAQQQSPRDGRRFGVQDQLGQPQQPGGTRQPGHPGQPSSTVQGSQSPRDGRRFGVQDQLGQPQQLGGTRQPGHPGQPPATAQGQQPPLDGRRPGADGRRSTPAQPVAVDRATSVVPHGDRKSFDIRHKNPDGSQMVIKNKLLPDGTERVTGFKQTENSREGTTTRIFSDGRRVTQGRDFERRKVGSGMDFVTKRNGLREAALPDGKPAFKDRFTSIRERDGRERRVIERTQYAHWSHGRVEHEERPRVHHYDVGRIHGEPVAEYRPSRFAPEEYRGFHSRFAAPVAVAVAATAAWVAFGSPATSYDDPVDLMGDMQISSGFEEGYANSTPSDEMPVSDAPEAAALRNQMAAVQQQVNTNVQGNKSLKEKLEGVDVQAASSQVQQAVVSAGPVQISEQVRQQVRQQVRLSVAMHQNGRSLVLADVLASGYAKIYLFQTAQPLNVEDVSEGECFLNTGDLIGFSKLPAGDSPLAEMKVVASGSNSCRPGELVQVRLTDLQEMLNGFSERVEDNMKRVSACSASGRC